MGAGRGGHAAALRHHARRDAVLPVRVPGTGNRRAAAARVQGGLLGCVGCCGRRALDGGRVRRRSWAGGAVGGLVAGRRHAQAGPHVRLDRVRPAHTAAHRRPARPPGPPAVRAAPRGRLPRLRPGGPRRGGRADAGRRHLSGAGRGELPRPDVVTAVPAGAGACPAGRAAAGGPEGGPDRAGAVGARERRGRAVACRAQPQGDCRSAFDRARHGQETHLQRAPEARRAEPGAAQLLHPEPAVRGGTDSRHARRRGASPPAYRIAQYDAWNEASCSTTIRMRSVEGRIVVRKCAVPGTCPKPVPGTTQMPVSSSSAMQ